MKKISFFLILLSVGCMVKITELTINKTKINQHFICQSDTSICTQGITFEELPMLVTFDTVKLLRMSGKIEIWGHTYDSPNIILPYTGIVMGRYKDLKLYPIKKLGQADKNGKFHIETKIDSTSVIYFMFASYEPTAFYVGKLLSKSN